MATTDAKPDEWEQGLLKFLFFSVVFNDAPAGFSPQNWITDTGVVPNFYISLHTAAINEGDAQTTNEATYTGYSRQSMVRGGSHWNIVGNLVSNDNQIKWGKNTDVSSQTMYAVGIGTRSTSVGYLLYYVNLATPIEVKQNYSPVIAAGALTIKEI